MIYKVKEWRKKRMLTQQQLAEKSGVSRMTIVAIESGKDRKVSTDTLVKLANALNVKVDKIFCQ